MLFEYKTIDNEGKKVDGTIEAFSMDAAIMALQKQGLIISSIKPKKESDDDILKKIPFFNRVSNKEIVMLSRQMSTLF